MNALTPDVKAAAAPSPEGFEACDCCVGVQPATPQPAANRVGLPAIHYRIGDHAQFKSSLLAGLAGSALPALAGLRTRETSDFTVGLIDAFACAADVLTFYQERIANESYLGSATERLSMQELGRLIGYRLKPGVAAETALAFALETPPLPPPGLAPEPGNFVTGVPASLTLQTGLKVQSVPGPGELPQTFETVEPIEARPAWNAMRPWLAELRRPGRDDRETFLAGVRTGLRAGDALLIVDDAFRIDASTERWDLRIIDSVHADAANDRTRVTWSRGLGSIVPFVNPAQQPQAYALRKRAAPYGHNAPMWGAMSQQFRTDYANAVSRRNGELTLLHARSIGVGVGLSAALAAAASPDQDDWPEYTLSPRGANAHGGFIDLDTTYTEAGVGSFVVLAKGDFNRSAAADNYTELFEVAATSEVSRSEFALTGKVSRLDLRGEHYALFAGAVRGTSVFVQSEALAFADYAVTTPVAGDRIPVNAPADGLLPGRRLLLRGVRASDGVAVVHACTLVEALAAGAARSTLHIAPPLAAPLRRDSVAVHANVALASHGESVTQVLGSGDAARAGQQFALQQLPLTHRAAPTEGGTRSELVLRVGDIRWTEVPSLYARAADAAVFTLATDERGATLLRFGDGANGARLPSGVNNIRAHYRRGIGAPGNVRADTLTQAVTRPLGLKSVANPLPASGGTDAEDAGAARSTMPLGVRTLGRAVSVLDYEDFARAFAGIAKAQAAVLKLGAGATIAVTVAGSAGSVLTSADPVWQNLLAALRASGDPHVAVRLLAHQPATFRVGLKVKCDAAYDAAAVLQAVGAALRARYAFDARALAQPVQQSDVIACVHTVPGVLGVDLDLLHRSGTPPALQPRLLAAPMRVVGGAAFAAELLTLAAGPLARLEVMA